MRRIQPCYEHMFETDDLIIEPFYLMAAFFYLVCYFYDDHGECF